MPAKISFLRPVAVIAWARVDHNAGQRGAS